MRFLLFFCILLLLKFPLQHAIINYRAIYKILLLTTLFPWGRTVLSLLLPLTHLSHQGFQTSQKLWQDRQKLLLAFLQERKPSSFAHHKRCAKQQHLSLTTLLLLYLAPLLPTYSYFFNYWSCQIIKEKLLSWNNFKLSLSSESLTLLHKNGRRLRWSSSKKKQETQPDTD